MKFILIDKIVAELTDDLPGGELTLDMLDLRYEARDIDQTLTNRDKIDQWFDAKTKGLNDLAKAQLKQKWGTMQRVLSSQDRLQKIVADVLMDMSTKPRLMDGHGNAMLVSFSHWLGWLCRARHFSIYAPESIHGNCAKHFHFISTSIQEGCAARSA